MRKQSNSSGRHRGGPSSRKERGPREALSPCSADRRPTRRALLAAPMLLYLSQRAASARALESDRATKLRDAVRNRSGRAKSFRISWQDPDQAFRPRRSRGLREPANHVVRRQPVPPADDRRRRPPGLLPVDVARVHDPRASRSRRGRSATASARRASENLAPVTKPRGAPTEAGGLAGGSVGRHDRARADGRSSPTR